MEALEGEGEGEEEGEEEVEKGEGVEAGVEVEVRVKARKPLDITQGFRLLHLFKVARVSERRKGHNE
jgi:hypothetical protein